MTGADAARRFGAELLPVRDTGPDPIGATEWVAVVEGGEIAYPVVAGITVALVPERLTARGQGEPIDVAAPRYAETYEEMAVYSDQSFGAERTRWTAQLDLVRQHVVGHGAASFPDPPEIWLGRGSTVTASHSAYRHLSPVEGRRFLQLGGAGTHAVKFLLAGADSALLVSPVLDELLAARELAEMFGVADRFTALGGIAEELPVGTGSIDLLYSGSSLHHCETPDAFPEIRRVLASGGRFASVDVWRAPLYDLGTKVFGRAHDNAHCRPFDPHRVAPARATFPELQVSWHGAVTRYPLAVLQRAGIKPSAGASWRLARYEDRMVKRFDRLGKHASIVLLRGRRPAAT